MPGIDALCRRAAKAALAVASRGTGVRGGRGPDLGAGAIELSVVLADDGFVRALNREYRGKDEPTNVLSFPIWGPSGPTGGARGPERAVMVLGDVVIAYETVRAEAKSQAKRIEDHLCHLVVHGVLHLLGCDHESKPEARDMEALEVSVLAGLGIGDPYAPRSAASTA